MPTFSVKQPLDWKGRTGGRPWMQQALIVCFRFTPLWLMYGVMSLIVPFYMLFSHKGYLASYRFFRQRFAYTPWKSFCHTYRNHFAFGQIILDRFAMYAGKQFIIHNPQYELFSTLANSPQGFLMLSSHVGNYELAGYSLVAEEKPIYGLVFAQETQTVMQNRQNLLAANHIHMVPVKDDLSHLFILNDALQKGHIVSMDGDRVFGSQKQVPCTFLGQTASFPLGPAALAVQRDVPILAIFVMKTSYRSYEIKIIRIEATRNATDTKRAYMERLTQTFAQQVEQVVRAYPTQWFNFYDFWRQDSPPKA